jgi:phosphomannomutase
MSEIRFGSDGWRGKIAEDYTFDNVRRATQGFASYLHQEMGDDVHRGGVVVGYDYRFGSEDFANAVAEVLAGNGIPVVLMQDASPTPVASFSILNRKAAAGVMITASHNPPADNGFKVRDHRGAAIAPDELKRIEARIPASLEEVERTALQSAIAQGQVEVFDPAPAYVRYIEENVDLEPIKQAGLKIAYDAMWGVGASWFQRFLIGGSTTIHMLHGERNPVFPGVPQPEPIPPNIDGLLGMIGEIKADVGIANDGDADRIGIVDEKGRFVTQLQVGGLLALYLLKMRDQRGPIVKTLSSTVMIDRLAQQYGLQVIDTGVGPKYVSPAFIRNNAILGATESGGYVFPGVPERDGVLAALYLLDMMVRTGRSLTELLDLLYETVGARYHYDRIDVDFPTKDREVILQRIEGANPDTLAGFDVERIETLDGFKFHLSDGGWLLIRFSGTEPIIRVYCETAAESKVKLLLNEGLGLAGLTEREERV